MMLQLQRYTLEVKYIPGKYMYVADTLSRAFIIINGIPEEMMSDNMPFASQEFTNFGRVWGIKLTTSSPNFPQSNGQSERAVQTLKHILKKVDCEG